MVPLFGILYAFYSDYEHLYRVSPCRTFRVVGHLGTFEASLSVRQFFKVRFRVFFAIIFIYFFFKYLLILRLIMIYVTIMTLLEKIKFVGHLGLSDT